ncbi:MAG: hypothetical protein IPH60_04725 [Flavobacteriales bacterium]|nr:hypothetical protein [Flavobacteriales bacterium]
MALGLLWCATLQDLSGCGLGRYRIGGITKFTGDAFVHFTERDGLRSRIVSAIHRTPDGLLWLATASGGVACWKPSGLKNYGPAEGLIAPMYSGFPEDRRAATSRVRRRMACSA